MDRGHVCKGTSSESWPGVAFVAFETTQTKEGTNLHIFVASSPGNRAHDVESFA